MTEKTRLIVQTRMQRDCQQLFFLYKAVLHGMNLNSLEFAFKAGLFDRNLAMFKDTDQQALQGRISDKVPDTFSMIEWKKQFSQKFKHTNEFYTIGSSAGGYVAMLFGHYLEVDEVWAFAPFTEVSDKQATDWPGFENEHRDLSKLLSNWNGKTRYNIYYCEDNEGDKTAAIRMENCPGVTLHPRQGDSHIVINVLEENGELDSLFPPRRGV